VRNTAGFGIGVFSNEVKIMDKNKELMFQVSVAMPKAEALSFGKTMPVNGDKYYIYKTKENPKARDAFRRES
jgi:hypothetical protein